MECYPYQSTQELVFDLNTSQSTICSHLKKIEKVSKLYVWIPHNLTMKNKDHMSIEINLLLKQRNDPFLKNIITSDKKRSFMKMINIKAVDQQG